MSGYADTKKLIEDTLVGRPAGSLIYPEGHQAIDMSLLDYIHSVELLGASELQGIATTSTVPVQPDNAKVSYIATVPAGQTYVFTNFHDQNGNSISITTGANTVSLLTFLWNGEYWQVQNSQIQLMLNITAGYLYAGIAIPTTNPGSPDEPVFYIAAQAGTYTNFGGIVVNDGEAAILKYVNSSWVKEVSGLATREEVSGLATREEVSRLGQELFGVNRDEDIKINVDQVGRHYVYNTQGAYSERHEYISFNLAVNPGEIVIFTTIPSIITAFGNSFKQSDFINEIVAAKAILIPNNCFFISVGYYIPTYSGGAFCWKIRATILLKFSQYRLENTVTQTNQGLIMDNTGYDCCFFYCKDSFAIKFSSSQDVDTDVNSFITFYDGNFEYLSYVDTGGYLPAIVPNDAVFACLNLQHAIGQRAGENVYINVCVPNINLIMRDGPSFLEFGRYDYPKKGMAAVGMHGSGEANLCWNMNYIRGIHKYYDKTLAAAWVALQGYSTCIQYSPANVDDSGDNDIWHLAGDLYALWLQNSTGKLVTGTSESEEKGDACFSGNRSLTGGITFAGLTDCVIEGNRKKGQRGDVFVNAYNDGDVYLAFGGGITKIGGRFQLKDVTPPSAANNTGLKGELRFDSNYLYVCVADNQWKRIPLSTW